MRVATLPCQLYDDYIVKRLDFVKQNNGKFIDYPPTMIGLLSCVETCYGYDNAWLAHAKDVTCPCSGNTPTRANNGYHIYIMSRIGSLKQTEVGILVGLKDPILTNFIGYMDDDAWNNLPTAQQQQNEQSTATGGAMGSKTCNIVTTATTTTTATAHTMSSNTAVTSSTMMTINTAKPPPVSGDKVIFRDHNGSAFYLPPPRAPLRPPHYPWNPPPTRPVSSGVTRPVMSMPPPPPPAAPLAPLAPPPPFLPRPATPMPAPFIKAVTRPVAAPVPLPPSPIRFRATLNSGKQSGVLFHTQCPPPPLPDNKNVIRRRLPTILPAPAPTPAIEHVSSTSNITKPNAKNDQSTTLAHEVDDEIEIIDVVTHDGDDGDEPPPLVINLDDDTDDTDDGVNDDDANDGNDALSSNDAMEQN